jgi:hypothetical protein
VLPGKPQTERLRAGRLAAPAQQQAELDDEVEQDGLPSGDRQVEMSVRPTSTRELMFGNALSGRACGTRGDGRARNRSAEEVRFLVQAGMVRDNAK